MQIKDILECRIGKELNEIASTALCDLPEDDGISCDDFLKLTESVVKRSGVVMATASESIERSVFDIIQVKDLIFINFSSSS